MRKSWQSLEHYLLIFICLAFMAGIIFLSFFPATPKNAEFYVFLLLLPALVSVKRKYSRFSLLLILLLVFSLGFSRSASYLAQAEQYSNIRSKIISESDVVLSGTLYAMPLFDGESSSIILQSNALRTQDAKSFSTVSGLVKLRLHDVWPQAIKPGDKLLLRCKLSRPYRFGNPGGFDYPAFLANNNIHIVGRINSTAHIHALDYERSWLRTLRYLPENIRIHIRDTINTFLPTEQAGIYRALLIGDRSGVAKNNLEAFKASGIFHILAISGLHLSLVASALFLLFYWLLKRSQFLLLHFSCKKLALLATIPPLCSYALLAGAQTPVLRSLIMVIVFIIAFCVQRQRSPFTTLAFAALLILVFNPLSLFTVSFQLSFAAVASLILLLPHLTDLLGAADSEDDTVIRRFFAKTIHWIHAVLLVSMAATIGTAPLLLHSFNRISTVGPIANLVLEPVLCLWSLPFGLLSIPFLFIAPEISHFLLSMGGYGITAAIYLTDFFSKLPYSSLWFATPSIALIICYYICLYLLFSKLFFKQTLFCSVLVFFFLFFPPRALLEQFRTQSELVFLDVGQGNSTFINFPGGEKIIIDGGGASSKKFNVGESVIAPYLWHRGFSHLDAILVTHPDADHYNGIPFLLRRFKPKTLWINGDDGHDFRYDDLLDLAEELNIKVLQAGDEQLIMAGEASTLQTVTNPLQNKEDESSNDKSIILRFTDDNAFSCILTGDISSKVERMLVENNTDLKTDFLQAPHHGSKTSSSYSFLEKTNPQQIIVSAGRFRPKLFPSEQLVSYCKHKNIPLLNTASHGAITIRPGDGDTRVEVFNSIKQ